MGILGYFCTHVYAHTNDYQSRKLPFALKGADALIWSVFRSLGLGVNIRPVMEDIDDGHGHSDEDRGRLVGLGLHRVKISDVGGYDDSLPTTSVSTVTLLC